MRDPDGARFLQTHGRRRADRAAARASVTDEAAVARAVAGADVVVNLVGILFERKPGDFQRIQAEGAGRVARLAAAAGVRAAGACLGDRRRPGSAEPLCAAARREGEAAVRAAFPGATILRPSIVFGPEDQFFNRFAGLAAVLPFMPVVGRRRRSSSRSMSATWPMR